MLIGPYVNGSAVIIGGLIGAMAGGKLPERVKTALPMTFGLCSVGLGITLVLKVKYMPAVKRSRMVLMYRIDGSPLIPSVMAPKIPVPLAQNRTKIATNFSVNSS